MTGPLAARWGVAWLAAACLASIAATGCRTVTPEARYHVHGTLVDRDTALPLGETRVALAMTRVTDPDREADEKVAVGRTDPSGSVTLVLRETGGEVKVGMWGEYVPPEPQVLPKLYLYVWRSTQWQPITLDIDPSNEAKAMPGHRWIEVRTLLIPPLSTGKVPPPYGPSTPLPSKLVPAPPPIAPTAGSATPGVKDIPAPPPTPPAKDAAVPSKARPSPAPIAPTPAPSDTSKP